MLPYLLGQKRHYCFENFILQYKLIPFPFKYREETLDRSYWKMEEFKFAQLESKRIKNEWRLLRALDEEYGLLENLKYKYWYQWVYLLALRRCEYLLNDKKRFSSKTLFFEIYGRRGDPFPEIEKIGRELYKKDFSFRINWSLYKDEKKWLKKLANIREKK